MPCWILLLWLAHKSLLTETETEASIWASPHFLYCPRHFLCSFYLPGVSATYGGQTPTLSFMLRHSLSAQPFLSSQRASPALADVFLFVLSLPALPHCQTPQWHSGSFKLWVQLILNLISYISPLSLLPFMHGADGLSGGHNPRMELHGLWMMLSWCESVGPQVSILGLSWDFTDDSNEGTCNHKRRHTYKIRNDRKLGERLNMLDDKLRIKNETDRLRTECNHIELNKNKYKVTFLG